MPSEIPQRAFGFYVVTELILVSRAQRKIPVVFHSSAKLPIFPDISVKYTFPSVNSANFPDENSTKQAARATLKGSSSLL